MAQRLSPDPEIYTTLDSSKIISTIERLSRRIGERFPDSGLYGVAQQLLALAHQSKERAQYVSRPIHWIRITIGGLIGLIIAGVVGMTIALTALDFTAIQFDFLEFGFLLRHSLGFGLLRQHFNFKFFLIYEKALDGDHQ